MKPLYVAGIGLWTPGYPSARAFVEGTPIADADRAQAEVLGKLKRRASDFTRLMVQAYGEALGEAGGDLATVPSVFASSFGELDTTIHLLEMMHGLNGELSPIRFAGSVHNTASGTVSIAVGNRAFTTSVAADGDTLPMAILECVGLLEEGAPLVAMVAGDEAPPTALVPGPGRFASVAVALVLASDPARARYGALSDLRVDSEPPPVLDGPHAERLQNPCGQGLVLIKRLFYSRPGRVALSGLVGSGWGIELS
jgi:hypothetical protein